MINIKKFIISCIAALGVLTFSLSAWAQVPYKIEDQKTDIKTDWENGTTTSTTTTTWSNGSTTTDVPALKTANVHRLLNTEPVIQAVVGLVWLWSR
jgi:hypothetical protein